MASHQIALSDDSIFCEYVPVEQFKGFVRQTVAVGPDLLALLIRDGALVTASHGANFAIGGFLRGVRDSLFGAHALKLLIADLKPFQITEQYNYLTRDHHDMAASITLDLQANPERPENVLGFASDNEIVTKQRVYERVMRHLADRVLQHAIGQVDAAELRGSRAIQDKIQADAMREVERVAGDMGLIVRAVSMRWALTDEDRAAMAARAVMLEQKKLDLELATLKRETERATQTTSFKLEAGAAVEKLKTASEHELRMLLLDQEVAFVDAEEVAKHRLRVERIRQEAERLEAEQTARLAMRVADAKGEVEVLKVEVEKTDLVVRIDERKRSHALAMTRLEEMQRLELEDRAARDKLTRDGAARSEQIAALEALNRANAAAAAAKAETEMKVADAEARRAREAAAQAAAAAQAMLQTKAAMSPDQLLALAVEGGASPEVARALVEKARAAASSPDQVVALLREQMADMKAQGDKRDAEERFRAATLKDMAIGVAAAAAGATGGGRAEAAATVPCADCGRPIAIGSTSCGHCGAPVRA